MSTTPIIYMIRHGEKPPNDGVGLNEAGTWRARCLPGVFGSGSNYNIKYILAEEPHEGKSVLPVLVPCLDHLLRRSFS
jgi:hypothetical protein